MSSLHITVLTPYLFALFVPFLYKWIRRIHTGWFVLCVPLFLFITFAKYWTTDTTPVSVPRSISWIPSLGIDFALHLDDLALLFSLIVTGMGVLVVLYSIFYMSKDRERLHNFYVYLLLFMGAMLGSVLSDNLMLLYVFWEVMSVSSFLLIAYWYQRKRSRYGAQKALLITMGGGFAMLLGFIMLIAASGTASIRGIVGMAGELAGHPLFVPAMLLILLGAFTKSAQFPFHIWLPDAMEAPTPISAYLHSATMVKIGIYLVARLTPLFGGHDIWFWIVTGFGLLTLLWGSLMAIRQTDLKALLAFSTVSQLGLIMSLLGLGSLSLDPDYAKHSLLLAGAILAAVFHLINHSIFKGSLFMVIGILDHETGTRDIRRLGGLMQFMPISFTLSLIGAFSMAGLPPFGGFLSKEMFLGSAVAVFRHGEPWFVLIPIVAWVASVFTFVYSLILVFRTFGGKYEPGRLEREPREAPIGMLLSPGILAAIVVGLFFFPNVLAPLLAPAVQSIIPGAALDVSIQPWHGWTPELLMTIGIIIAGTLLYMTLKRWSGLYNLLPRKLTLNNAYDNGLVGMERLSAWLTRSYMTGSVRHYIAYIFAFLIVVLASALFLQRAFVFDTSGNSPIHMFELALGFTMAAAAIYIVFSKSRLISIIALSIVGFIVSLYFVIFRAPDLALTQLVVETISTTLFLLCFYFLPKYKFEIKRIGFRFTNMIIALGVGVTITLIALSVQGNRLFEPISDYFKNSYELAGARNMVNAILVDFRAFDTMLEIVVLFTAGIGIYTLIRLRQSRRNDP